MYVTASLVIPLQLCLSLPPVCDDFTKRVKQCPKSASVFQKALIYYPLVCCSLPQKHKAFNCMRECRTCRTLATTIARLVIDSLLDASSGRLAWHNSRVLLGTSRQADTATSSLVLLISQRCAGFPSGYHKLLGPKYVIANKGHSYR